MSNSSSAISPPSPSASVSATFVEQFFEKEKENARLWLHTEMDSMMEILFGQLKDKFLHQLCSSAQEAMMPNSSKSLKKSNIPQKSNKSILPPPTNHPTIETVSFDPITVKQEVFDDENGMEFKEEEDEEDDCQPLPLDIQLDESPDEESVQFFNNRQQLLNSGGNNSSNSNSNNNFEDFDDLDYECDSCEDDELDASNGDGTLDGQLYHSNFDGSNAQANSNNSSNNNFQPFEDSNASNTSGGSVGRPLKRYRFEQINTDRLIEDEEVGGGQVKDGQSSVSTKIEDVMITLSLKCPQPGCSAMPELNFSNEAELAVHLRVQHQILPFRCYQRGCTRSFEDP